MNRLKRAVRTVLTADRIASRFEPLTRGAATVFMLHRFADPERGIVGHEPARLRRLLADLRRKRYNLVSIGDLCEQLESGASPRARTVAFTVDDGYCDFPTVGAPIFAEFECPSTVFLTTGFLDGRLWLWWDRIAWVFANTRETEAIIAVGRRRVRYRWSNGATRRAAAAALTARLKGVADVEKLAVLDRLAAALRVEIPAAAPAKYAAMSWDEVRAAARTGATFGPHTVTHPILAETSDAQAEWEIRESWKRVRAETDAAAPVFCYPNGDTHSFGRREVHLVRAAGLQAGCSSQAGYVGAVHFSAATPDARYALPRFALGDDSAESVQILSGVERLKRAVRSLVTVAPGRPVGTSASVGTGLPPLGWTPR